MKRNRNFWLLVISLFGVENYLKAPVAIAPKPELNVQGGRDSGPTGEGFYNQPGKDGQPLNPGEISAIDSQNGSDKGGEVDLTAKSQTPDSTAAQRPGMEDKQNGSVNGTATLTLPVDTTDAQTGVKNSVQPGVVGVFIPSDATGAIPSNLTVAKQTDGKIVITNENGKSATAQQKTNGQIVVTSDGATLSSTDDPNQVLLIKNGSISHVDIISLPPEVQQAFKSFQPGESLLKPEESTPTSISGPGSEIEVNQAPAEQSITTRVVNNVNAALGRTVDVANVTPDANGKIIVGAQIFTPVKSPVLEVTSTSSGIITGNGDNNEVFIDQDGYLYLKQGDQLVYKNNYQVTTDSQTSTATRSLSQQVSNKTNNALSISGNKKVTTTDPQTNNTTVTTIDKNGNVVATKITNSWGTVIETSSFNPVSGAKTTTKYNPADNTTTIIKTQHVTEEQFKEQYTQLTQEIQNQMENVDEGKSSKFVKNKTIGQTFDATFPDVNARIDLINNLPNNTRATIQNELATINKSESTLGSVKRTASRLKNAFVGSKSQIITASQKSATRLVQSSIDNLVGKDTLSGQSIYSLPEKMQTKLINDVAERLDKEGLFDTRNQGNDFARAQIITNAINDLIMPAILPEGVSMSSAIASDGTYSSTVTKGNRTITSKVDNKGNMTERTMSTTDSSGEKTTFTTTYNSSQGLLGSAKTVMTKTDASGNTTATQNVSDSDGKLISAVTDYCTSMTMIDITVGLAKVGVVGAKQAVINGVSTLVSIPAATTVGVVGLVAVKAGSMLLGAKFSEPVIKASVNLGFELAGGGERIIGFSDKKGQLFTTGGVASNLVEGKGFTTSNVDPNERIYNPIGEGINGLVSAVAGKIMPVWSGKQMFSNPTPVTQAAA